jgi:NDP-sugar pyrophosphorylase family protein
MLAVSLGLFRSQFMTRILNKAIILAGGFGTRLRDVIGTEIPKPMAEVNGKPFISYILDKLSNDGFEQVIISIGHKGNVIKDFFKSSYKNLIITYSEEKSPLGTGGAIILALTNVASGEDVLIINGDSYINVCTKEFYNFYLFNNSNISMLSTKVLTGSRYGSLDVESTKLKGFFEKSTKKKSNILINSGYYIMNQKHFNILKTKKNFSLERDFFPKVLRDNLIDIFVYESNKS